MRLAGNCPHGKGGSPHFCDTERYCGKMFDDAAQSEKGPCVLPCVCQAPKRTPIALRKELHAATLPPLVAGFANYNFVHVAYYTLTNQVSSTARVRFRMCIFR